MATETSTETVNDSAEETSGQEVDTNQETPPVTSEPEATDPPEPAADSDTQLPDNHPLVKTLAAQKEELKTLRQAGQKVTELETQVTELTSKATSAEEVQARYDRLETFLTQIGGPLSRALDSKSFTTALFETDTDIAELVTKWHKDNPSATSQALQGNPGNIPDSQDMNALLRTAAR